METLNLQPLARAITRLDEGWQRYLREQADEQIRDGLIQRFEFTYEISHKTLNAIWNPHPPIPPNSMP